MSKTLTLARETALAIPYDPASQTLLAAAIFLRENSPQNKSRGRK